MSTMALTIIAVSLVVVGGEAVSALIADGVATAIAAWYCWRSARLKRALLTSGRSAGLVHRTPVGAASQTQRRLVARHLSVTMAMSAHVSLFPTSSARGQAIVRVLIGGLA